MKKAIVILSDPSTGTAEALGRAFNGLTTARDYKQAGAEVAIHFLGTGVRWPAEFSQPDHIANGLYNEVKPLIASASAGCAGAFGATAGVEACGIPLSTDNELPGVGGFLSLRKLEEDGFSVLLF